MASDRANLIVSWKAVAIGATVAALASLTGLAVVATIKNADTLSVVALAVAIVAFVIQILVFIVQAAASSQQELRAQELYGSTTSILSTIAEKAEGTRRDVNTISERMLSVILGKAISETTISTPPDSADFGDEVAERAAQLAGLAVTAPGNEDSQFSSGAASEMRTFPGLSEAQRVFSKIEHLDQYDLAIISLLGSDQDRFERGILSYPGFAIADDIADGLIERGLVQDGKSRLDQRPIKVLTSDGKVAARMLLADNIPPGAPSGLADIRAMVERQLPGDSDSERRLE